MTNNLILITSYIMQIVITVVVLVCAIACIYKLIKWMFKEDDYYY